MKEYELFSQLKVINSIPIILRIDGRSFSNYTKLLKLNKPYDIRLRNIFINVSKDLMNEFNPSFIHVFSDEFNLLFEEIPFNGRVEKINSVISSFLTSSFMKHLYSYASEFDCDVTKLKPASFDSRIIITHNNIHEYYKWRQDEAWRNCLNGYAQNFLNQNNSNRKTSELLHNLNKSQINELLFKNGINISKVPVWQKRGFAVYRKHNDKENINPFNNEKFTSIENEIIVDLNMKLFKKN